MTQINLADIEAPCGCDAGAMQAITAAQFTILTNACTAHECLVGPICACLLGIADILGPDHGNPDDCNPDDFRAHYREVAPIIAEQMEIIAKLIRQRANQ